MSSLLGTQVHSADLADAVSRLRRAMRRAARAADPGSGLSVAQLEMLSCMAENPGSRPGQLARLLRLAPSSVATLSNSLRQAGLVTRTGGEGDRRTASLDLTPAGEAAVLRWKSLNERLLSLALRELPPDSRVTLLDALPALADLAGAVDALADEPSATDALPGEPPLAWRDLPGVDLPGQAAGRRPYDLMARAAAAAQRRTGHRSQSAAPRSRNRYAGAAITGAGKRPAIRTSRCPVEPPAEGCAAATIRPGSAPGPGPLGAMWQVGIAVLAAGHGPFK